MNLKDKLKKSLYIIEELPKVQKRINELEKQFSYNENGKTHGNMLQSVFNLKCRMIQELNDYGFSVMENGLTFKLRQWNAENQEWDYYN